MDVAPHALPKYALHVQSTRSYKQLPLDTGTPFLNAWGLRNCNLEAGISLSITRLVPGHVCPGRRYINASTFIGRTPALMVQSSTTCQLKYFLSGAMSVSLLY